MINFKIILIFVHSISRESLHFDQIRTKEAYLYFFNVHIRTIPSLFSYEGIISIAVKNGHSAWGLLCFDFVYYWCQSFFLLALRTLVHFLFSLDSPLAPTPFGQAVRSLQRAVFTNFISFLWGIKSSRSRPRRKERGLEHEQGCGRGEVSRSKLPLLVSYHPHQSTL